MGRVVLPFKQAGGLGQAIKLTLRFEERQYPATGVIKFKP